jgi:hypothetical protein
MSPVTSWGSFSYAFGPVVALVVVAALALVLRWASRRGGSVVAGPPRPGQPEAYGMLVPIASPTGPAHAGRVERRLASAGISCTVAHTTAGLRVLVWPGQAEVARRVLAEDGDG